MKKQTNFIEWDNIHFNINLITNFGYGENTFRNEENGHYSLWIEFSGTKQEYVKWYKSKSERDKDYKKLKRVILK